MFELSAEPKAWGARFEGYKRVLDMFPDGQWAEPSHFIAYDRGVTQGTFQALWKLRRLWRIAIRPGQGVTSYSTSATLRSPVYTFTT